MTSLDVTAAALSEPDRQALDRLESSYRTRGYDFRRGRDARAVLPEGMRDLEPDAVALGTRGNDIVQVLGASRRGGADAVRRLRERVRSVDGWTLVVVHADEVDENEARPNATSDPVSVAAEARALRGQHPRAALLLYWSALEGLLRAREPTLARDALSTRYLIDALDSYDYIDSSEREGLLRAASLRNALAHGRGVALDDEVLTSVASVVHRLVDDPTSTSGADRAAS